MFTCVINNSIDVFGEWNKFCEPKVTRSSVCMLLLTMRGKPARWRRSSLDKARAFSVSGLPDGPRYGWVK